MLGEPNTDNDGGGGGSGGGSEAKDDTDDETDDEKDDKKDKKNKKDKKDEKDHKHKKGGKHHNHSFDLSDFVPKTQLLSPICPKCPDCVLSPTCSSCGGKNKEWKEPASYGGYNLSGYGYSEGFANHDSVAMKTLGKTFAQTTSVLSDVASSFRTFGNSISSAATEMRLPYIAPKGAFTKDTVVSTADGDVPRPQVICISSSRANE